MSVRVEFDQLKPMIAKIPGDDGWFKSSNQSGYEQLGKELLQKGLTVEEVEGVLNDAFWCVAGEFGA